MFRINSINLNNFGPFKETQDIVFPQENGVIVVYGDNMRGKTTLLNAIRYALFGKVLTRAEHRLALHTIGNWESAAEGKFGFTVTLKFECNSNQYELTRSCSPRKNLDGNPECDDHYIEEIFLKKNNVVLGPDETASELFEIMPEQISRFFLFDGELLQQYEELLRNESLMGDKIKSAIEQILGVPLLINARIDLYELRKLAQRKESKAAQANQKTQELGNHHQQQMELLEHHEKEVTRLKDDLEEKIDSKLMSEKQLKKTEKLRGLLSDKDAIHNEIEILKQKVRDKKEQIKEFSCDLWQWIISDRIEEIFKYLEKRKDEINYLQTKNAIINAFVEQIRKSIESDKCCTCEQDIDMETISILNKKLSELKEADSGQSDTEELDNILKRKSSIEDLRTSNNLGQLKEILLTIEENNIALATKEDRLRDIFEQTKDLDESELRRMYSNYEKCVREISIIEQGISDELHKIENIEQNVRKIIEQLDKVGGPDMARERKRRMLYDDLLALFAEGVDVFRNELRQKVEAEATAIFKKLTTEPDYERLQINDNYGLMIIHKDGTPIPVRSAGAEHVVALALIGSLQRNAPLRGPIIMDSPFGRLDEMHTTKVIRSLPEIAEQVLLLVYKGEIDPHIARKELKGHLRGELEIHRISAKNSTLRPYKEAGNA